MCTHTLTMDIQLERQAELLRCVFMSVKGQKTSLTQETELLESLLQEVEHQVVLFGIQNTLH